jgi:hypothetical protein
VPEHQDSSWTGSDAIQKRIELLAPAGRPCEALNAQPRPDDFSPRHLHFAPTGAQIVLGSKHFLREIATGKRSDSILEFVQLLELLADCIVRRDLN